MIAKLDPVAREKALNGLKSWDYDPEREAIVRSFAFLGFGEAFAFMTRVALLAERADHHPDWSNVWNRVTIALTTHDACGLSQRDIDLAAAIDKLA